MTVPFYEEKQTNPAWMGWAVVIVGTGMLVFVITTLAQKWPANGNLMNDDVKGLLATVAGILITAGVMAWLVFSNHLTVSVDREGLTYLFWPVFWKPKHIPAESLAGFEIRKMSFMEYIASGGSRRAIRPANPKTEVCIIRSFTVAELRLRDGRKVLLGTTNPDGLGRALKKLQAID